MPSRFMLLLGCGLLRSRGGKPSTAWLLKEGYPLVNELLEVSRVLDHAAVDESQYGQLRRMLDAPRLFAARGHRRFVGAVYARFHRAQ
jgi:hypothetical protein